MPGWLSHVQMAVKKENLELDSAATRRRPIELITENGFGIVRTDEIDGARPSPAGTYGFMVRDPHGHELEIMVEIGQQAIDEITLRSRGRISSEGSYWISCAERHLAEYLWENDDYPPDGNFGVDQLTPEDLNLSIRCPGLQSRRDQMFIAPGSHGT